MLPQRGRSQSLSGHHLHRWVGFEGFLPPDAERQIVSAVPTAHPPRHYLRRLDLLKPREQQSSISRGTRHCTLT